MSQLNIPPYKVKEVAIIGHFRTNITDFEKVTI